MKASKTHAVVAFVFVFCASSCIAYGQVTRVPSLTNSKRAQPITTPASEPIGTDDLDDHEFSESVENTLQVWNTVLQLGKGEKLRHLNIAGTNEWGGNPTPEEGDPSPFFKYAVDSCHSGICHIAIGFVPTDDKTHTAVLQASLQGADGNEKQLRGELKGKGRSAGQTECLLPSSGLFPTLRLSFNVQGERKSAFWLLDQELAAEFGTWSGTKEEVINCYFQTSSSVSVFTQVQSIFNAASGSTTVAADIASLNFNNGTQLTLGTNVQAGSGGNSSTPAPSATATVPTLSSTSAAQAAQNLLWGGNLYVYGVLPIYFNPNAARDRWSLNDNLVVREGVDVQNFSGSSTTFNNPTTHFNFMTDGYWQYDAIPPLNSTTVPGSIFLGGRFGYSHTTERYYRSYGFNGNNDTWLGQLSFGILVNSVAKIAAYRSFGPTQTFVDSTTNNPTTVNNFKAWSFAISYQSKAQSTQSGNK